MNATTPWLPTTFRRWERAYDTSVGTARIVTDAGPAYIKPLGNREGPHVLACELVGTQLARWFGLRTLEFSLMDVDAEVDEIFLGTDKRLATSGPAFVTRATEGHPWGGGRNELENLENPEDIPKLVVFDTWTLNCDRYQPSLDRPRMNRDNVFLSREGVEDDRYRLIAIDHTHCFTCGRQLTLRIADIDQIHCEEVFGIFPEFMSFISRREVERSASRLRLIEADMVNEIVEGIPPEWDVRSEARRALTALICQRAAYIADGICEKLKPCFPERQMMFSWPEEAK